MIQVSNEFKKAIKDPERKIKGYVEVLYDLPNIETTVSSGMSSTYTNESEICNGIRVENLYGGLDYLPLDGTRLVMGETNTNSGFISNDVFEDINSPEFYIDWDEQTEIKGITLYFRTNIPTRLNINYSDGTQDVILDNENESIQIIFDTPKTINSIQVVIQDAMYPDRKLYINEVDLGVTQVYKDQDLIDFTVDEEVNKLVEEVPINETNITLNNMSNLFNPLNPSGIVPYLSDNTLIKPYIGVLTDGLGVEYVKMGEFYFDSYTNNSDATTTLVGKNLLKKIENESLKDDNYTEIGTTMSEQKFIEFLANYPLIKINDIDWYGNVIVRFLKKNSLFDFIKDISFFHSTLFYVDRDNKLNLKNIDNEIRDNITKSELINDAEYKKIDKINTISVSCESSQSSSTSETKKIYEESFVLTQPTQVFTIENTSGELGSATITQNGATSMQILFKGAYLAFVKITGVAENTVTITANSNYSISYSKKEISKTNKKNSELETKMSVDMFTTNIENYLDYYSKLLDIAPSYEMRFDYNGDPSLEAGDYINVETPYGYKKLFIQKNRIKFDGGLEGSIEGVE